MRPLVQRLSYVSVDAIDPEQLATDTSSIIGPRVVDRYDDMVLMSSNSRHAEFIIHAADTNAYRASGLEAVSADAVDEVARRCSDAGIEILSETPSLSVIDKSVTFRTSEGLVFEVHTPMPLDRPQRYHGPGLRPKCIDHINFTAENPEQWSKEMNAACGFLLTERTTGYEIAWMRAADGRHHTVAAVQSKAGGLHHISWDFNSFEDFKRVGDSLIPEERQLIWGPGRHGAGDNLFIYYRDTAEFLMECTAEMEIIHDVDAPVKIADPGENLSNWKLANQWGALAPIEWLENYTPISKAMELTQA